MLSHRHLSTLGIASLSLWLLRCGDLCLLNNSGTCAIEELPNQS